MNRRRCRESEPWQSVMLYPAWQCRRRTGARAHGRQKGRNLICNHDLRWCNRSETDENRRSWSAYLSCVVLPSLPLVKLKMCWLLCTQGRGRRRAAATSATAAAPLPHSTAKLKANSQRDRRLVTSHTDRSPSPSLPLWFSSLRKMISD